MASLSIHPLSYCTLTPMFSQHNATVQSKAAIPLKQFPKALSCEHTADVRGRSTATAPAGGATTAQDSRELNTTLPRAPLRQVSCLEIADLLFLQPEFYIQVNV